MSHLDLQIRFYRHFKDLIGNRTNTYKPTDSERFNIVDSIVVYTYKDKLV